MTLRETIAEAIRTAWNTGTPGGVPAVVRDEGFDISQAGLPSALLRYDDENPEPVRDSTDGPLVRRWLLLALELRASGEVALDPLLEWMTSVVGGKRLGGSHSVREAKIEWKREQGENPAALAIVWLEVSYQTRIDDATKRI